MRVSSPPSPDGRFPDPGLFHAPDIVEAANSFAGAIYRHSKLPLRMFEAARIATALINGCTICMNWRTARDATYFGFDEGVMTNGPAPDEAFYQALLEGDQSGLTARELLAVRYAEGMGRDPKGIAGDEEFWSEFKSAFADTEIVDLSYCIAGWMGLGRVAHVLGADAACAIPEPVSA